MCSRRPVRNRRPAFARHLLLILCALLPATPVLARESACNKAGQLVAGSTLNLRIDNDLFGGENQDQGYSNGFLVSWVSPDLADYVNDPCLPWVVRYLNRYLAWLHPQGYQEQNMTAGFGQVLYTPSDRKRTDVITDDRPYAAALLLSIGYHARSGDHLRTSQIRFGIVGPSALGEEIQNGWHRIFGMETWDGWDNQLRDEPILQLIHERRRRLRTVTWTSDWGWDAIGHWGGSLGNFATYLNVGTEWRMGLNLPDDFGTAPLRPAGENSAPVVVRHAPGWSGHLFVVLDARWVAHDITLDGNTFRSSHRVDSRPFVADIGYGLAFTRDRWRFAFARYHRTREFDGQRDVPVYGSFTIGRRF